MHQTPDVPDESPERRSAPSLTISLSHLPYYLALLIMIGIAWSGISQVSKLVDAIHASTNANVALTDKVDLLFKKMDGLADRVTRLENAMPAPPLPAARARP